MSAKLTLVLFILVCFEIGFLLVFLPWHRSWEDNSFLFFITETLNSQFARNFVLSGYCRGAVTGIGLLNILVGIREILSFSTTLKSIGGADTVSHN